jgi:hypothetical protein
MDSIPASARERKHAGGWLTVIALGLLAVALLVCLFVLIGFPAEAQMNAVRRLTPTPSPAVSMPRPRIPVRYGASHSHPKIAD